MQTREELRRDAPDVGETAVEVIEELTGLKVNPVLAADIVGVMPSPKKKLQRPYIRDKAKRARDKAHAKRARRKAKVDMDEVRLSRLKVKLLAGDPSHPLYAKRLASAQKSVKLATSLPVVARQKWANPEFQAEMEQKGHKYNPAQYKGWMPFDVARRVQQEVVGARSRGEYEFFVKLYELKFLPARPDRVYEEEWQGWSDFLGVLNTFGRGIYVPVNQEEYRPFYEALTFVRSLKLTSPSQWRQACIDKRVPIDIPLDPHLVYPDQFVSMEHWLGLNTALDKVTGKVVVANDVWVLYRDGRPDAFWWAKMSADKYAGFVQLDNITVERTYLFEGELSERVWQILDEFSEQYEDDKRERFISSHAVFNHIKSELDNILKWSHN